LTIGVSALLSRFRSLIEGDVVGATYAVTANRFRKTDNRLRLAEQPEDCIHRRYEILPVSWTDGFAETGPANVTGQLVDSTAELILRVGYYLGGGDLAGGDLVSVSDQMAEDAFLLRRVLTIPDNYSGATTTVINVNMGEVVWDIPEPPDRRALMTMPLTAQHMDDWSSEA
jgi:hypothetical protein